MAARLVTPLGPVDHRHRAQRRTRTPAAQRPHRAHRRRRPVGLGRARRARRDGLAHAGHGWPVHRPGLRAPALPRSPDLRLRSRATGRCSGSSSAPCSSATGCWRRTCATARVSRASSGSWPRPAWRLPPRAPRPSPSSRRPSARAATRRTAALFPWAELALVGTLETELADAARRRRRGRLRRARWHASASATAPPAARWRGRTAPT